jgi:hypothetical protein
MASQCERYYPTVTNDVRTPNVQSTVLTLRVAALCVSDMYVCVLPSALVLIYHGGRYQDVFHWLLLLFPKDLVNYIG